MDITTVRRAAALAVEQDRIQLALASELFLDLERREGRCEVRVPGWLRGDALVFNNVFLRPEIVRRALEEQRDINEKALALCGVTVPV